MTTTVPDYTATLASMTDSGFEEEPHEGDLVHSPDISYPAGAVVSQVVHDRRVPLYNTRTHEEVWVNSWQADDSPGSLLKRVHTDIDHPEWLGKLLFSRTPTGVFRRGTFKCWLHPDQPERASYTQRGMAVCRSAHLASEYQVEVHMSHKHKQEYAAINSMKEGEEKEEDRRLQREMIHALGGQAQITSRRRRTPRTSRTAVAVVKEE